MDYARLGRTGLKVSRLCLGTMNFGPLAAEAESFAILDRALELGINFLDTADVYGWRTGGRIAQANAVAAERHCRGLVSAQSLYTLTARTVELEVIPACRAHGLGLLPWSPLAGGLLAGALAAAGEGRRASERIRKRAEERRAQLEAWEGFCRELGEAPADVAPHRARDRSPRSEEQ